MRFHFTRSIALTSVLFAALIDPPIVQADPICECLETPGAARFDVDGDHCGECWPEDNCVYKSWVTVCRFCGSACYS